MGSVEHRWSGRPVLSGVVLVAAHAIPVAAAVFTSALLSRRLHEPDGWVVMVGQWMLLLGASTAVLLLVDRGAKRLLPLAALLKLSMLFPDSAPKRLQVARRSGSLRNLQARLEEAKALGADDEPTRAAEIILSLVGALHAHDRHTRGHSERVRWFTDLLAEELKLPAADRDRLRWAALLHDIGKLQVSPKILNKPAKLEPREWHQIHRHPDAGARMVAPMALWLGEWSATVAQHHEKFDGSGYPRGLKGDEISLGARIVAVADAYEVMTAARSYKKAASASSARRQLTESAGTHFDPVLVRAFLNISIGRLRWVSGPVAWVAQIPFVGWIPRFAEGAASITGQAAGAAGTAALLTGSAPVEAADPSLFPAPTAIIEGDVATPGSEPVDASSTTIATRVLSGTLTRPAPTTVPPATAEPAPPQTPTTERGKGKQNEPAPSETTVPPASEAKRSDPREEPPGSGRAVPASKDPVSVPTVTTVPAVDAGGRVKKDG